MLQFPHDPSIPGTRHTSLRVSEEESEEEISRGNTHSIFNFSFKTRISKLVTRDKESEKNIFAFPKANLKVPGPNIYLKKLKRGQTVS